VSNYKIDLSREWLEIADAVADEYYPKGKSIRRGEFLRDQAVIYTKFVDIVDDVIKRNLRITIAVKAVMLAEDIMEHFEDDKSGVASDLAWYELIEQCELYIQKEIKAIEFVRYIETVFGFDGMKEFLLVKQKSYKRYNHMQTLLNGEDTDEGVKA
jgi:hypothetical protein